MTWKPNPAPHLVVALLLWGSSIAVGFWQLQNYEATPGRAEHRPLDWPANSPVRLTPGRVNIVLLAHPRCPCTRASLVELQELLGRCPDQATAHVLFMKPRDAGRDWEQTDLWRQAAAIPGVRVHTDENGTEARRRGAATSGHVVVYRGDGTWLFSGGLTNARGQAGHSPGAEAIWQLVSHEATERTATPVFGCPLFDADSACNEGATSCPSP